MFFFINVFCFLFYRAVDEDVLDKDQILLQKEAEVRTRTQLQVNYVSFCVLVDLLTSG